MVDPGYDLLVTTSGTTFDGAPFVGLPLGTYNFGGSIGLQNVGNTDTIVQRLGTANAPSGTVAIQMDALQLVSATPISFGGGPLGFYYVTLQSVDMTGPASTGGMTINFAPNTFTSSLDVFFDVHYGALDGPIVDKSDAILSNGGDTWGNVAPAGAITIPGVNLNLNGNDTTDDFWPAVPVPEPTTVMAGALLLLPIGMSTLRILRKKRTA